MLRWLRLAARIDRINERIGEGVSWLALLMVLVGAYNAVTRYLGRFIGVRLSSNAFIELQWYMFSLIFLLAAAYTLRRDAHVRVDIFYARVGTRARAWINLLGTALFLLPFCFLALRLTWPAVRNSWAVLEMSPDPGGLPRYPLKTMILVAFVLLILQGVSIVIKQIAILRGVITPEESRESPEGL
jgi:TRAP-type mannitol/chloroaromatic compound transport system permease small subunit